jgi:ATP-dependent DNA helicase RecG
LIANGFFRSGQIEAWGRGIEKMKNGCRADNLPEPEFEITATAFSISFQIRNNNKAVSKSKIYSANGSGINSGITEIRQRIMDLMSKNPSITTQKIADEIAIDRRNVESHVRILKKIGLIERTGARKNGRWVVVGN